jgi:hypothetical protein
MIDQAQIDALMPYLKEGETPVQRIEREMRDTEAITRLYKREREINEELLAALKRIKETKVFLGAIAQEMMDNAIQRAENKHG